MSSSYEVDETFAEDANADELTAEAQIKRITKNRMKDGIRDGITDGQNMTLQSGFNIGYKTAFLTTEPLAIVRGFLWSLLSDVDPGADTESRESCRVDVERTIECLKELENKTKDSMCHHVSASGCDSSKYEVEPDLKKCASDLEKQCQTVLCRLGVSQEYLDGMFERYKG